MDSFNEVFELLASYPAMGKPREELAPGLRSFPIGSHMIFYEVEADYVVITRVLHQRQIVERARRK